MNERDKSSARPWRPGGHGVTSEVCACGICLDFKRARGVESPGGVAQQVERSAHNRKVARANRAPAHLAP